MNDCRRIADRLTQFADGALPPEEQEAIEHHLRACPPCRGMAAGDAGGRAMVRERAEQLRAASERDAPLPPGLRTRCEALARATTAPSPWRWLSRWAPVGLGSFFVLLTATAIFALATSRSNTLLAAQLTADHVKCFRVFPGSAGGQDAQQVERMLAARYGTSIHLPAASQAEGLGLLGARRCVYAEGRVPHVMYRVHGQDVSLFILEGVSRHEADVTSMGHRTRIWTRGKNTFVLVSSAAGDMDSAARYVRREAQ